MPFHQSERGEERPGFLESRRACCGEIQLNPAPTRFNSTFRNTRIEAHTHPDDRAVTVISGAWHFGYGTRFDEKELKELPAGSFYTEPPNTPHFASTGDTPAVVQISGFGPSGTRYEDQTATK